MRFNLDFSLNTTQERLALVKTFDFSKLTKADLELCANYLLWGKDPEQDMTSTTDRGEVFIKTKFKSYTKTEPLSLEALMESPAFDESELQPFSHYKKVKPTIDKEKAASIPGMEELWKNIENLDHKIKVGEGKIEPQPNEAIPSSRDLYMMKHQLIELRKTQFSLVDQVQQEIQIQKNYGSFWFDFVGGQLEFPVFPVGVVKEENDPNFACPYLSPQNIDFQINVEDKIEDLKKRNKPFFNFLDKDHVYQLCLHYSDLKAQIEDVPDSPLWNLLWTLDFYIDKANLSPQQRLIVDSKKKGLLNKEIQARLQDELGIYHQDNYISTIWNKVVGLIVEAADLNYDEWCSRNYKKAWKKCSCCKQWKLRDNRNFVKKAKALDGLTSRCKKCDQEKRQEKRRH